MEKINYAKVFEDFVSHFNWFAEHSNREQLDITIRSRTTEGGKEIHQVSVALKRTLLYYRESPDADFNYKNIVMDMMSHGIINNPSLWHTYNKLSF